MASRNAPPPVVVGLNAVILAVTEEEPRLLTVQRADHALARPHAPESSEVPAAQEALPFGPLDPHDATLELGVRAWVREQTGLELGYAEQLYTFADRHRDPIELAGGPRVVSVAYLALVREGRLAGTGGARWRNAYDFFPWEDWRGGPSPLVARSLAPALERWSRTDADRATRARRRERAEICFGLHGVSWDAERVLERYELLYEAGLVFEAWRDRRLRGESDADAAARALTFGERMAVDHRRMAASALGRLRGKIRYRPVVFELLPPEFTLFRLQRVVEALAGVRLHKQNFRRLVAGAGLVEGTGQRATDTGGRPAELFGFRREVLRERPAPGVGLPGARPRG